MSERLQRELTISNKLGLHARAAARLVQVASEFVATISIATPQRSANAKSIMGILLLAAARGTRVTFSAEGPDAQAALDAIAELIQGRFGEDS